MFIFEILTYVFFAWIMFLFGKNYYLVSCSCQVTKSNNSLVYYCAFYVLICAIRYNVGVDCLSYIKIFNEGMIDELRIDDEALWNFLVKFVYNNGLGSVVGLGICAFVQIYFIVKAIKDYPLLLMILPIVLFGGRYYLDLNAAVRQMTAACIVFWGTRFILSKSLIKYVLTVIIASFIHHSALMLIPFYFIPNNFVLATKRNLMLIVFGLCFIAGQTPSFQDLIEYASNLANISGYSGYGGRIEDFLSQGHTSEALSFGPMMLSYFMISLFIIWYGKEIQDYFFDKYPIFNIWYNFSFFYSCSYFLVANISHIFIRPVMYFGLFQMITATILLSLFWVKKADYSQYRYLFYAFILVIWTNISWDITKNYTNPWNASTYKVFFLK